MNFSTLFCAMCIIPDVFRHFRHGFAFHYATITPHSPAKPHASPSVFVHIDKSIK